MPQLSTKSFFALALLFLAIATILLQTILPTAITHTRTQARTNVSAELLSFSSIPPHTMPKVTRSPPAADGTSNNNSNSIPTVSKRQRVDDEELDSSVSSPNTADGSMQTMISLMMRQFEETKQLISSVRSEIKDVNRKIDVVKTELQRDINSVKDECASKFQQHDIVLTALSDRMSQLSQNLGGLENCKELVVSGIPFTAGEDLSRCLKKIGEHLAVKDTTAMTGIRRMRTDDNNGGLIVVEFALKSSRDEFYSAYLRKRDLKLRHVGLESDRRVYINESLTSEARKLKSAAIHLKKAGKLASVFTKQGVLHVKTTVSGLPIVIQTEDELAKYS